MPPEDRRTVRDLSDSQPFRLENASTKPICQRRFVNSGDDIDEDPDGLAPSPLGDPPAITSVVAPVNLTKYIDTFCSFLEAR